MAINLKNPVVERLAGEVAGLAHENKTEAIRRALEERRARLLLGRTGRPRVERWLAFLEREAWPILARGKAVSKAERESILGYGRAGV